MKSFIIGFIAFTAGFGAGYLVSNKITKKKYLKKADEEVESVKKSLKEYYENKDANKKPNEQLKTDIASKKEEKKLKGSDLIDKDSIDYDALKASKLEQSKYREYVKHYGPNIPTDEVKEDKQEDRSDYLQKSQDIFVISPEEYQCSDFDVETLHYYKDGYLTDSDGNVIKDIKGIVGDEALNSFGVYEEDVVYVKNLKTKIDYEILFEEEEYVNVAPKKDVPMFPDDDD